MINENQYGALEGRTVVDRAGNKIGTVGQLFLNDQTGRAEWVTVNTGLFGTKESFVPVRQADLRGDDLVVPVEKDQVKDAPKVDSEDGHISDSEQDELYRYYGRDGGGLEDAGVTRGRNEQPLTGGRERSDDDAMTVSEERLRVGTQRVETGRVRLRKYVVTENVQQTVPVTREEVRLEREPITEENRGDALSGPELTESEHEVILTEERPVVQKETVPVERVKLTKDAVQDQETVTETIRKEKVDELEDTNR